MTLHSSVSETRPPDYLPADTVKFFLVATRYCAAYLNYQLHCLHSDPFLTSILDDTTLGSTALLQDFSTVHHLAAWLETAFITLEGDNRNNQKFMKHFTEALQREKPAPPIKLKHEKYRDILANNMTGMLQPICYFYIEYLQAQRDNLATGNKILKQDLNKVDVTIAGLLDILAGKKFAEVTPFSFLTFGNNKRKNIN